MWESLLSFHHMGSRVQTQVVKLVSEGFTCLSDSLILLRDFGKNNLYTLSCAGVSSCAGATSAIFLWYQVVRAEHDVYQAILTLNIPLSPASALLHCSASHLHKTILFLEVDFSGHCAKPQGFLQVTCHLDLFLALQSWISTSCHILTALLPGQLGEVPRQRSPVVYDYSSDSGQKAERLCYQKH